jgi:hypothetical protein
MIYPCACRIFLHVFRNIVTVFLVPLLGNTNPSGDAKKRQQAFLVPLLGMDLKTPYLVIAFRNANTYTSHQGSRVLSYQPKVDQGAIYKPPQKKSCCTPSLGTTRTDQTHLVWRSDASGHLHATTCLLQTKVAIGAQRLSNM